MIEQIIEEIEKSIENGCYYAALVMTMTLPDICGKAEFPDYGTTRRYKEWCREYVEFAHEDKNGEEIVSLYYQAEFLYDLRCNVLHQGSPGFIFNKKNCKGKYILSDGSKYGGAASSDMWEKTDKDGSIYYECTFRVDVTFLSTLIIGATRYYFNEHKDKFSFDVFEIERLPKRETWGEFVNEN